MIKRDYYEILEIARNAAGDEIKKSYRRLALKYHPDRCKEEGGEDKFKEASEAYEVLSDPERKQIYDAYGHSGLDRSGFHGFNDVNDIFSSMGGIFEEFFGGMGGSYSGYGGSARSRVMQGADLRYDLSILFMEAAHGIEKEIDVMKQVNCEQCEGSGQEPGTERIICQMCGGSGNMTQRQGFFMIQTVCPQCRGEGYKIEKHCTECRGQGRVNKSKKLSVKVPAGVEDGMRLVLRGEGQAGTNGGPPGDLYVFIGVKPHDYFERYGDDLVCKVPISFPQAALGAKVTIPSLDAEIEVEVPAGTETGDELRLKEKGLADVHGRGRKGDQVVIFMVKTPRKLSKKQKKLLEEFMES
ncbi:MAG: molecular chaperone DnaJ [Deltaproteobacteria bacterium]|jgi:molecular chaperone DnaJ|nr:molecular chaperone DnaJ [Deltaproteobacteria bacterium]